MPDERRIAKIEKAIQQELSGALVTQIDDPRVQGIVSITSVKVSPDLSNARVYYTLFGDEKKKRTVARFFKDSTGFFRTLIAKRLDGRKTPTVVFHYDEGLERKQRIESLLDKALSDDQRAQEERGEGANQLEAPLDQSSDSNSAENP